MTFAEAVPSLNAQFAFIVDMFKNNSLGEVIVKELSLVQLLSSVTVMEYVSEIKLVKSSTAPTDVPEEFVHK